MLIPVICTMLTALTSLPLPEIYNADLEETESRHRKPITKTVVASNKLGWTLHLGPMADIGHAGKTSAEVPQASDGLRPTGTTRNASDSWLVKNLKSPKISATHISSNDMEDTPVRTQQPKPTLAPSSSRPVDHVLSSSISNGRLAKTPAHQNREHRLSLNSEWHQGGLKSSLERLGANINNSKLGPVNESGNKTCADAVISARSTTPTSTDENRTEVNMLTIRVWDPNITAIFKAKTQTALHVMSDLSHTKVSMLKLPETQKTPQLTSGLNDTKVESSTTPRTIVFRPIRKYGYRSQASVIKSNQSSLVSNKKDQRSGTTLSPETRNTRRRTIKKADHVTRPSRGPNLFKPKKRRIRPNRLGGLKKSGSTVFQGRKLRRNNENKQNDQKTEASMMRPQIYDWDPDDSDQKSQATTKNHPSSKEDNRLYDHYYDYSPEDYSDYSYEPLENTGEEYSKETKSREREHTIPAEEGSTNRPEDHPGDANSDDQGNGQFQGAQKETGVEIEPLTTVKYEEKDSERGVSAVTTEAEDLKRIDMPGNHYAEVSQKKQVESVTDGEGFILLVATTTMAPVSSQHATNDVSTTETHKEYASKEGSQLIPIASANQAASALRGQMSSDTNAAVEEGEPQETQDAKEDKSAAPFFSFAEVPAYGEHRFGYRKGNTDHFVGRMETAKGAHVETVVVWGDKKGGYGKHIWEYNHSHKSRDPSNKHE